jgi:hypothetical protein
VLIGDETEGYTKAHMDGIDARSQKLGVTIVSFIKRKSSKIRAAKPRLTIWSPAIAA